MSSSVSPGGAAEVGFAMAESIPHWSPPRTAPPGAPNVVVVLCDDLGYSDLGCFGSEIATPHLDQMAEEGLRFSNFHATPMCSPTRAALLTGRNPHSVGFGYVAQADPGFPALAMELPDDVPTLAETLQGRGYATFAVGKWHLAKDSREHEGADLSSWPTQRGFDRFYGFLDGFTDYHNPPRLVRDNTALPPRPVEQDGYYLTDDLTREATDVVRQHVSDRPDRPFFLYLAHAAVHAPLHAPAERVAEMRGRYDAGWDQIRNARFRKQQATGLARPDVALPDLHEEPLDPIRPWEELTSDEQRLFARYMEVYAAMVTTLDDSVGELRAELERLGVWENTVVLFLSDNGASREGEEQGTTQYLDAMRHYHDGNGADLAAALRRDLDSIDRIGAATTMPHYPKGWATVSNTPFRLFKINAHAGGQRVPLIVGGGVEAVRRAAGDRHQYAHVIDLAPTVLDLIGVSESAIRAGLPVREVDGVSLLPLLADPEQPSPHVEQYTAMSGHRGYYRDGWEVVSRHRPGQPFGDHEWELYDLRSDPAQTQDRSAEEPGLREDLARAWDRAAKQHGVLPLDEGLGLMRALRPAHDRVLSDPVTIFNGTKPLERYRSSRLIAGPQFRISAHVTFAPGDRGTLLAHGGQGGGYALVIDDDAFRFVHNAYGQIDLVDAGPITPGCHTLTALVTKPDSGHWDVELSVDGVVRTHRAGLTSLVGMAPFEGIEVGRDTGSPVDLSRRELDGEFKFTGSLERVEIVPVAPDWDAIADSIEEVRRRWLRYE